MARGRVGSMVYYIRKGEQIARSLSQSVANPQTSSQMSTRVTWNNLVQFFKRSRFWMHWGAFESKKSTWSDYNAFMSANAMKLDVALTKEQAAAGYAVVADYVVTKGSLPTVNITYSSNKYVSDIYFGPDADFDSTATIADLSNLLLNNNNGLQAGDQLSFIVYLQGGNANAPTMICRAFEMILNTQDTTPVTDIFGDFLNVSYEGENGALTMQYTGQGGATIVVSREVGGKLKVSSQTLVLDDAQQSFLTQFTTAEARRRAARSYGSDGQLNFLSAGYSNVSSVSAPIALSILSVQGKTAGVLNPINGGGVDIVVALTNSVEDVSLISASMIVRQTSGTDTTVNITSTPVSDGGSQYTFPTVSNPGGYIKSFTLSYDGNDMTINFALPEGNDNNEGIGS